MRRRWPRSLRRRLRRYDQPVRYRFLEFELDTEQRSLLRDGTAIALRRQTWRVLLHLIERAPAVVGKNELLDAVWGHQALSPGVVAQSIRELRDALGDHVEQPRAIATKHRVGYQFIATVTREAVVADEGFNAAAASPMADAGVDAAVATSPTVAAGAATSSRRWLMAGVALLIAALALLLWPARAPPVSGQGWPDDPLALRDLRQAQDAAYRFDYRGAVRSLAAARAVQDTARMALFEVRLRIAMGEHRQARQVLATVKTRESALARRDQLLLEAIEHELEGRYAAALERQRIVAELDITDSELSLALFELQHHERVELEGTYRRLADDDRIPVERKLVLSAQLAGVQRDIALQAAQADAALASAGHWPGLAAVAMLERARASRRGHDTEQARDELERAARALQDEGLVRLSAQTWLEQIDLVLEHGDLEVADARLVALEQAFAESGDAYMRGRLLHTRGRIAIRSGRDAEAVALFAAAARQHESVRNLDGTAFAMSAQSGPLRRLGRADEARATLESAVLFAERSGIASVQASVHGNLANLHTAQGRPDEAARHFEVALSLFRQLQDRRHEAVTLGNLAVLAEARGDSSGAEDLDRQALAISRELNAKPDIARLLLRLAAAARDRGELPEATEKVTESIDLYRVLHRPAHTAMALLLRAELDVLAAQMPSAQQWLDEAAAKDGLDAATRSHIEAMSCRIACLAGQRDAALDACRRALHLREPLRDRSLIRNSHLDLARLDLAAGRSVIAEQSALAVAAEARSDAHPGDERRARLLRVEAALAQGRAGDAERELVQLRSLLDQSAHFIDEMEWSLLRARLDADPAQRQERLRWLQAQADERGLRLLALRAQGELVASAAGEAAGPWRAEVRALGLAGLLPSAPGTAAMDVD